MRSNLLVALALLAAMDGCAEGGAGSPAAPPPVAEAADVDSDHDGLTDAQEAVLGTSPYLADTDGDGFTDAQEVLELGFDPQRNPLRFNPRLADVPRLEVRIVSAPQVTLNHSVSASEVRSFDNTRATTEATGFSTNVTTGLSLRSEISNTIGTEISGTYGVMSGVTASASASRTWSDSSETSFSWSQTQSRDNSRTLSESRGFSESHDVVKSGGRVQVAVNLRNTGSRSFTVQTLALGLRKVDPATGRYQEIGQLEPESDRTFQNITSLAPGASVEGLVVRAELPLNRAEFLLGDGAMSVRTVMYELLDENGRSFDHLFTTINARTAELTIDPGDGGQTHYVATYTPEGDGLPLSTALTDVLRATWETGRTLWAHRDRVEPTRLMLLSLNGVRTESKSGGYWTVQIETDDGRGGTTRNINPFEEDLDLDAIRLLPNTAVRLVYIVDIDRDGLGARTEAMLGTDPYMFDTDGDGVGDGDELLAGTNPLIGLATARIMAIETLGRTVRIAVGATRSEHGVIEGVTVDFGDGSPPRTVRAGEGRVVEFTHVYDDYGEYAIVASPVDPASSHGQVRTGAVRLRLEPALVRQWSVKATPHGVTHMVSDATGVYLRTTRLQAAQRRLHFGLVRVEADGTVAWAREMGWQTREEMPWWGGNYMSLALGDDGTAYVTDHHHVFAIDREGTHLWQTPQRALSLAAGSDGMVFYTSWLGRGPKHIGRIDGGGDVAWRRALQYTPAGWMPVQLTVAGNQLLLTEHHIVAFDTASTINRVRRVDIEGRGDETFDIAHPAANLQAASGDDGLVLAGNMGGYLAGQRPARMAVWCHDGEGNLLWSDVAPSSSTRSWISSMDTTPDGHVFVIARFWIGDAFFSHRQESHIMLIGWDADGRRIIEMGLETLPVGAGVNFQLGADAGGVFIARKDDDGVTVTRWTHQTQPAATVEEPR